MFRFSHRSCGGRAYPTLLGVVGIANTHDALTGSPTAEKIKNEILSNHGMTGWDRVKEMYRMSETGMGLELQYCVNVTAASGFLSFIIGGTGNTKFAVADFKERNQATLYQNTHDAQRSLQDYIVKQFLKGAFPMAIKVSSFVLCYSLLCSTLSCYRNKTSVSDFVISGGITGAIFAGHRGVAGAISGGLIGLTLGVVTGVITAGLLYASGVDMNEVRMWHYEKALQRKKLEHKSYLMERERSQEGNERVAFYIMSDEEKKSGRIIDHLDALEKKVEVVVPEHPPLSMLKT